MRAVHHGGDDPVLHGGHRVREAVSAQEPFADAHVQPLRLHVPQGLQALLHVQGGRHEEVAHHRSQDQRASHPEEDYGRGRGEIRFSTISHTHLHKDVCVNFFIIKHRKALLHCRLDCSCAVSQVAHSLHPHER